MDALIFDFDGLVMDTESTDFESWRSLYEEHGQELPRDRWVSVIGTDERSFNPALHLRERAALPHSEDEIRALRRARRDRLVEALRPLPGVEDWLGAASARGLRIAIASSSPRSWVEGHLRRVGLVDRFELLMTADRVSRVKPDPELYLRAVAELGVRAERAIALEDSPHGLAAARAAGLYCVAIPGPMTRDLPFDGADLVLPSLAHASLDDVLAAVRARGA